MRHPNLAMGATLFLLIHLFLIHGGAGAAESVVPLPVSPGLPDAFTVVVGACPTFSWVGPTNAESQELVVYEVDESGAVLGDPTLTTLLPARASSWTPPADECLERGRSYAWSVRAPGAAEGSGWGRPRFFSVPAMPSEEEFRAGLELVSAYLAARESDPSREEGSQAAGKRDGAEGDLAGQHGDQERPDSRVRTARAATIKAFRVGPGGAVEAASFTGDGSGLTDIGSAAIATGAVGIDEIATGAVGPDEIRAGAVGSSEIATDAVGADEIATGAVGSSEIATGAVGADEIATAAVGSSEIATGAVGAAEIATGAVGAAELSGSLCLVIPGFECPAGYTFAVVEWRSGDDDYCQGAMESACLVGPYMRLQFCCN